MRFVSSIWIKNRLIICELLPLSSWRSVGNRNIAFSLPIGPWQKSCSITHPFWSLPNKGFSQEEKVLNNVSLKKNSRLYYLTFGSIPRLCNSRKGSHEQPATNLFSRTEWSTTRWGRPTLHCLCPSSSWLVATFLGSKGQNMKTSHTSVMSYLSVLASFVAVARGSR